MSEEARQELLKAREALQKTLADRKVLAQEIKNLQTEVESSSLIRNAEKLEALDIHRVDMLNHSPKQRRQLEELETECDGALKKLGKDIAELGFPVDAVRLNQSRTEIEEKRQVVRRLEEEYQVVKQQIAAEHKEAETSVRHKKDTMARKAELLKMYKERARLLQDKASKMGDTETELNEFAAALEQQKIAVQNEDNVQRIIEELIKDKLEETRRDSTRLVQAVLQEQVLIEGKQLEKARLESEISSHHTKLDSYAEQYRKKIENINVEIKKLTGYLRTGQRPGKATETLEEASRAYRDCVQMLEDAKRRQGPTKELELERLRLHQRLKAMRRNSRLCVDKQLYQEMFEQFSKLSEHKESSMAELIQYKDDPEKLHEMKRESQIRLLKLARVLKKLEAKHKELQGRCEKQKELLKTAQEYREKAKDLTEELRQIEKDTGEYNARSKTALEEAEKTRRQKSKEVKKLRGEYKEERQKCYKVQTLWLEHQEKDRAKRQAKKELKRIKRVCAKVRREINQDIDHSETRRKELRAQLEGKMQELDTKYPAKEEMKARLAEISARLNALRPVPAQEYNAQPREAAKHSTYIHN